VVPRFFGSAPQFFPAGAILRFLHKESHIRSLIAESAQNFAPILDVPLLSIKVNDSNLGIIVPGVGRWADIANKTALLTGKIVVASFGYQIFTDIVFWQNQGAIGVVIGWGQADDWLGFPEYVLKISCRICGF
jgi:hypothetical protein